MVLSFDLRSEPWIPVLSEGAPQPRDVSLRESLANAPSIRAIVHPSPLVSVALHRLLLAVLHRVFGPEDDEEWSTLWKSGEFDMARLDDYLGSQSGRFDVFHPQRPFYQSPGLPNSAATSVAKLGHEFSAGNNPMLFDHSQDNAPAGITPASAARLLVAHQAFAIGGLIGRLPGDPPSAEASHLVKAAVVSLTGDNLFETLMLNMARYNDDEPFDAKNDLPAWEQEPPAAIPRLPHGYLDLLTWQSRRVLLFPGDDGLVREVAIMAGYRFPQGMGIESYETMAAYAARENPAKGQPPWAPVGFRPEKALWRDSVALLQGAGDVGGSPTRTRRPLVLDHVAQLQQQGFLDRTRTFSLGASGMSTDRAKVFLWRSEQMPLPAALLRSPDQVNVLAGAIRAAEDAGAALRSSVRDLAAKLLDAQGKADPARVSALVDSLAPHRSYWPLLDLPFRTFVRRLSAEYDTDEGQAAGEEWSEAIRSAAKAALLRAERALETSARGFRAAAEARPRFAGRLTKALEGLAPASAIDSQEAQQ